MSKTVHSICKTIILALFLVLPGTTSSGATVPDQLRILTYNIYTVFGAPGVTERIQLLAEHDVWRGYDVVILTELFKDEAADYLLQTLSAEYPYQTPILGRDRDCMGDNCWDNADGWFDDGQLEDGGVVIISKWPIVARQQVVFRARCGIDALSRKGFVYAQVDINGTAVHIIGTHLQADPMRKDGLDAQIEGLFLCPEPEAVAVSDTCTLEWDSPFAAVRVSQLKELTTWLDAQPIPTDELVIIGGDLNIDRAGAAREYAQMLCLLHVNPPSYGGDPALDPPWYTYDARGNALLAPDAGQFYLDYLLVHAAYAQPPQWHNTVLRVTAAPENWDQGSARGYEFSDHFPVVGSIAPP